MEPSAHGAALPGGARGAQGAAARDGRAGRGAGARSRPRRSIDRDAALHRRRAARRRADQRAAHRDRRPLLQAAGAAPADGRRPARRSSPPSRSTPTSSASATWPSTSPRPASATSAPAGQAADRHPAHGRHRAARCCATPSTPSSRRDIALAQHGADTTTTARRPEDPGLPRAADVHAAGPGARSSRRST